MMIRRYCNVAMAMCFAAGVVQSDKSFILRKTNYIPFQCRMKVIAIAFEKHPEQFVAELAEEMA